MEELATYLEELRPHLCHWFTVDDLMYLKRGGRISASTALLGTALQIKPVMHTDDDGKLANVSKARGRKASIRALVDRMEQMGIVSPPEGQKPRAVLISEAQWMERKLRRDPQSEGAKE